CTAGVCEHSPMDRSISLLTLANLWNYLVSIRVASKSVTSVHRPRLAITRAHSGCPLRWCHGVESDRKHCNDPNCIVFTAMLVCFLCLCCAPVNGPALR